MEYNTDPNVFKGLYGQMKPYLSGRKNIQLYPAMPHRTVNGTVIKGNYNTRPEITRIIGYGNGGMSLELSDETVDEIMSKPPASETNVFGGPDYPMVYNPVYKVNAGPVNVKVINPIGVKEGDYELWLDSLVRVKIYDVYDMAGLLGDTTSKLVAKWHIKDLGTGVVYHADTTIIKNNEQLFLELGLSVQMTQPYQPGPIPVGKINVENSLNVVKAVLADNNGLIYSSVVYSDSASMWLSGIEDMDVPGFPLNWIRSGTYQSQESGLDDDWGMQSKPPNPWDPTEAYEKIARGTWAPYALTTYGNNSQIGSGTVQSEFGPALNGMSKVTCGMGDLASVDIVFTPDKSKWSRCPVIEMCHDSLLAEGHAVQFGLRASPSVDKDGNYATIGSGPSDNPDDPNYISDHGMGWFPGYAINVETGERMNLMFSEDSYLGAFNGRDMLFNPPPRDMDLQSQLEDENIFSGTGFARVPVLGGKHYVYVMKHNKIVFDQLGVYKEFNSPAYDAGKYAFTVLDTLVTDPLKVLVSNFYAQVMYVGMPMGVKGQDWLSNDATVKIRVATPYRRGYTSAALDTVYPGMDVNNQYPVYQFTTKGISTEYDNPDKMVTDLDEIRVVPNPYYAYSAYENNALDNRIKITNLPEQCTITIYDASGIKIKRLTKDDPLTAIEWDLKNFAGVPISGGVYYFHVEAPEGEHVVKWFCTQRIPDLNTF
jgi:hypothetical protein